MSRSQVKHSAYARWILVCIGSIATLIYVGVHARKSPCDLTGCVDLAAYVNTASSNNLLNDLTGQVKEHTPMRCAWQLHGGSKMRMQEYVCLRQKTEIGQVKDCSLINVEKREQTMGVECESNVNSRVDDIKRIPLRITVLVHGIISIKPHLTVNNLIRFLKDDVKDTYYEKSIAFIRQNAFFYKNQAMGPLGLNYIDQSVMNNGHNGDINRSACAIAYLFDQMNEFIGSKEATRYYLFGWSGLLSPQARYEDGTKLFEALEREVCSLRKQGFEPKIRVIGYSHGGNVALNLSAAHMSKHPHSSLSIDELILLGTPIQHDTDYLINDPIFKRVYSIYSLSDRVQKLDFFSLNRFFSGRVFKSRRGFSLPDKLVQIQIKMTSVSSRCPYSIDECVRKTSDLCARGVISGNFRFLKNSSPGHAELWAFGWTPEYYRSTYPLYPLPTVAIVPLIINTAKKHSDIVRECNNRIVIDVRPEHEYMLLRERNKKRVEQIVPFMSREKLDSLKKTIKVLAPENYTKQEYEKQTCAAIKESHRLYKNLHKGRARRRCEKRCKFNKQAMLDIS